MTDSLPIGPMARPPTSTRDGIMAARMQVRPQDRRYPRTTTAVEG